MPFDPIPGQTQPGQILFDPLDVFFLRPFRIGVIDAQNERTTRLSRDGIVKKRRAQVANVQPAGGGWGETSRGHLGLLLAPIDHAKPLLSSSAWLNRPAGSQIINARLDDLCHHVQIHIRQLVDVKTGLAQFVFAQSVQNITKLRISRHDV